jgi:hypothetical protein
MSYEVQRSFYHFWKPGRYLDQSTEYGQSYMRWHKRNKDIVKAIILALAFDANVIIASWEDTGGVAIAWCSVPTLAERIERTDRQTQRLLRILAEHHEIGITECDGRCYPFGYHARNTRHYVLFQPEDDDNKWGPPKPRDRAPRKRTRRAVSPSNAKKTAKG